MNIFARLKHFFVGDYLAETENVFERARIDMMYTYTVIMIVFVTPFQILLFSMGYHIQFWLNAISIAVLPVILLLLRRRVKISTVGIIYASMQLGNSLLHGAVYSYRLSLQGAFWMLLGVLMAFFVVGRRAGVIASLVLCGFLIFCTLNEESGMQYFYLQVDQAAVMEESPFFIITPFALNIYMLWLFVTTIAKAEKQLRESHQRNEELLLNILPAETAQELKAKGSSDAKYYDLVTVLFADIKNFSGIASDMPPRELVSELHECFKAFDQIISRYSIEKIKTIGDAYLCASGIPAKNTAQAQDMVRAAKEFIAVTEKHNAERSKRGEAIFEFRIGIHSGPIVAGVVGIKKFAFDIWGDTVNTASRMQQNSEPNRINISETTYDLVKNDYPCEYRGEIEVKNKGKLKMYFVS